MVLVTQGSLRVALGYILSPPSEAESTVPHVFRSNAFQPHEVPGCVSAGAGRLGDIRYRGDSVSFMTRL